MYNQHLQPKCLSCGHGIFQTVPEARTITRNFVNHSGGYDLVCCQKCGGVVGAIPQKNPSLILEKIAAFLKIKV